MVLALLPLPLSLFLRLVLLLISFCCLQLEWRWFIIVSRLVPLVVALVDIHGICFLTSCFWVAALLLRGVCSVSSSDVWFSSPILVFSSFFCSSCLCFSFSFEVLATAGPFFTRIYRNNDVITSCLTSLFLGRRVVEIILLQFLILASIVQPTMESSSQLWRLFPILLQLVIHVILLCVWWWINIRVPLHE